MSEYADALLLVVLATDLFILATSSLVTCVRTTAVQGVALGLLPLVLWGWSADLDSIHVILITIGTIAIKAGLVPTLLSRTIKKTDILREVEPFVSLHVSVLLGAVLVGLAFGLSRALVLPREAPSALLVPVSLSTILLGFLVVVSRRKAITQVVGYLMLENGVFVFGQSVVRDIPFVVELGLLLDVLVGVFVFGITIHHIRREFDSIYMAALTTLRDVLPAKDSLVPPPHGAEDEGEDAEGEP